MTSGSVYAVMFSSSALLLAMPLQLITSVLRFCYLQGGGLALNIRGFIPPDIDNGVLDDPGQDETDEDGQPDKDGQTERDGSLFDLMLVLVGLL